uniref:PPUP9740 n=1 Tax=Poeciliopsis prolifica TaxID=188132 RepID=A0A0S7EHM5_9TELE
MCLKDETKRKSVGAAVSHESDDWENWTARADAAEIVRRLYFHNWIRLCHLNTPHSAALIVSPSVRGGEIKNKKFVLLVQIVNNDNETHKDGFLKQGSPLVPTS